MTQKLFLFIRTITIFLIFIAIINLPSFSQSADDKIYEEIDLIFFEKSPEKLDKLLSSVRNTGKYSLYEDYVMRKTRSLLLSNQYELIQKMSLVLVDQNLDNTDAVNLYLLVENFIERRNIVRAEQLQKQEEEAAYVASASTTAKQEVRKNYNTVENKETGSSVFVNPIVNQYYSDFTWQAIFNIGDFILSTGSDNLGFKFGMGVMGDISYHGDKICFIADGFADFAMFDFSNSSGISSEANINFGVGIPKLSQNFFVKAGFLLLNNGKNTFSSPSAGVGLHGIRLFNGVYGLYYNYHFSHLWDSTIVTAMTGGMNYSIPLTEIGNCYFSFNVGLRDSFVLAQSGPENKLHLTIGFGVLNNE